MNLVPHISKLNDEERKFIIRLLRQTGSYHEGNLPFANLELVKLALNENLDVIYRKTLLINERNEEIYMTCNIAYKLDMTVKSESRTRDVEYRENYSPLKIQTDSLVSIE